MNRSATSHTFVDSQVANTNFNVAQKYKVVLLGDQSVGKTSIINRFIFDTFDGKDHPTVGIDFISKTLYYDDKTVKLQIWDTAGQERFRSLIPGYVRDCAVAIIVYDITNRQTFSNLKKWIDDVRSSRGNDVIIVIVSNKIDLEHKRTVSKEEGESLARDLETLWMEVSAKSSVNVSSIFQVIAGLLPGNESHRMHLYEDNLFLKELNVTGEPNANINLIQQQDNQTTDREQGQQTKSCSC